MHTLYLIYHGLETNWFFAWITAYGPTSGGLELFHYFSLFIVVGSSFYIDLRLLGLAANDQTLQQLADRAFPAIWIAMVFNFLSGFTMFAGSATGYLINGWFYFKMCATVACLISVYIIQRNIKNWDLPKIPVMGKLFAVLSIILWIGTILIGVEVPAITGVG
jgi:hypothetical protein